MDPKIFQNNSGLRSSNLPFIILTLIVGVVIVNFGIYCFGSGEELDVLGYEVVFDREQVENDKTPTWASPSRYS